MQRKLVKQGASTLMVSLPSSWCHRHMLDKGNDVTITEQAEDLLITAGESTAKREATIALTQTNETAIRTILTNGYRNGFDTINVTLTEEKQYAIIQQVVKTRLIGFDVTRKGTKNCTVESISEPTPEQFETLFKKIFQNCNILFEHYIALFEKKTTSENIEDIEERIQKYDNFCRRALAKTRPAKHEQIANFLSILAHAQREIYHIQKTEITKCGPKTLELLREAHKLFKLVEEAYIKKNTELIEKIHEKEKKLIYKDGYEAFNKTSEPAVVHHIISCIRFTYLSTSPLATILL